MQILQHLRRHAPALVLILTVGFLLRIWWLSEIQPHPITENRFDDTGWYWWSARYIANGDGYVNPFVGTPTAGWPPGYPFFLGGIFYVFGEGVWQVGIANIVLSLLTVIVVYAIGLRLFDRRVAIMAAAALAIWPGQIYFTSLALSEPLFTLLFALAVLLMLLIPDMPRWRGALVISFGAAVTAAALTRGNALMLLPLAVATWAIMGHRWKPAITWGILATVVVAIFLSPWVARNQRELGSPVIISTNLAGNIYIGHHDGATGRMGIANPVLPLPERGDMTQPEFEVATERLVLRLAWEFIREHPEREIGLTATKIRALWEADSTALDWNSRFRPGYYSTDTVEQVLRRGANGFWYAALILSGIGLFAGRGRWRDGIIFMPVLILAWTLLHILFFGDPRFHYPVVFVFALLGARGIVAIYEAARRIEFVGRKRYAEA